MALALNVTLAKNALKDGLLLTDLTTFGSPNKTKAAVSKTKYQIIHPDFTYFDYDSSTASDDFLKTDSTQDLSYVSLGLSSFQVGVYLAKIRVYMNIEAATYALVLNTGVLKLTSTGGSLNDNVDGIADADEIEVTLLANPTKIKEFTFETPTAGEVVLEQDAAELGITINGTHPVSVKAVYTLNVYMLNDEAFKTCFYKKIAGLSVKEASSCIPQICISGKGNKNNALYIKELMELMLGYEAAQKQFDYALYDKANTNMIKLLEVCEILNECC